MKSRTIIIALLIVILLIPMSMFAVRTVESNKESNSIDNECAETQSGTKDIVPGEEGILYPQIDYLIVVNSNNPVPDDWEEGLTLSYTHNSVGDDVYAEVETYKAYLNLRDELKKQGVHLELDSGFRSLTYQQKILDDFTEQYGEEYAKRYVAVPGYSEHHTGLALDLYLIVNGTTVYENEDLMKYPELWEKIHVLLPDYGFILSYPNDNSNNAPYEPWHIRYVGKEAAKEISEQGITLEEYVDSLK